MEGRVKIYNSKKGYGYVTGEDEKDYYFHARYCNPPLKRGESIQIGMPVSFDLVEDDRYGEKQTHAKNIKQ